MLLKKAWPTADVYHLTEERVGKFLTVKSRILQAPNARMSSALEVGVHVLWFRSALLPEIL